MPRRTPLLRRPTWKEARDSAVFFLVLCFFAIMFTVVLLEWMVGCGERWTDAQGVQHIGSCVIVPLHK